MNACLFKLVCGTGSWRKPGDVVALALGSLPDGG
jgi:hypothetical protein